MGSFERRLDTRRRANSAGGWRGRARGASALLAVAALCTLPGWARAQVGSLPAEARPLEVWRATLRAAAEAERLPTWEQVEAWLAWPTSDPGLAEDWVRLLDREGWPDASRAQRAAAMGDWARRAGDEASAARWIEALERLGGPAAAAELADLCSLPRGETALEAADAWVQLRDDAGALAAWIEAAATGERTPPGELLARLLEAYGGRVVDAGRELEPRVWGTLAWARRHADRRVRDAAVGALDGVIQRLLWLDRLERVGPFLDALDGEGWETQELTYRRGVLALSTSDLPAVGVAAGARLVRESAGRTGEAAARWRLYGQLLQGIGQFAEGRSIEALEHLGRAGEALAALRSGRPELRPYAGAVEPFGARVAVDLVELQGLVALWQALALRDSERGQAEPAYWDALRRVHARSIEAQLLGVAFDSNGISSSFDGLLERQLAPRRLLAQNERLPARPRRELLDALEAVLGDLSLVAPGELPGFVPEPASMALDLEPRIGDPLEDPERLALLAALPLAELGSVDRRIARNDNRGVWRIRQQQLLEQLAEGAEDPSRLLEYRTPSAAALFLAEDRRTDGDAEAAAALAGRARDALDASERALGLWRDWTAARLALLVGASYTDLDRGREAEGELERALTRLGALVNSLEERLSELERGRIGVLRLEQVDPSERRSLEAQIEATRLLEADALVSLAVNANVRLLDPERALAYFELAYERRRDDFTKVLLACYQARAGEEQRARELLDAVIESPGLYYNLACTHALLGDADRALEYLGRELTLRRHSPGSLARQKEWAAADPDLESLWDDPRFQALVAP
jgi:hypothetical protein